MKTRKRFYLKMGDHLVPQGKAHIQIVGSGKNMYIWVGDEGCYAHVSGEKTLECLANSILEALNDKP